MSDAPANGGLLERPAFMDFLHAFKAYEIVRKCMDDPDWPSRAIIDPGQRAQMRLDLVRSYGNRIAELRKAFDAAVAESLANQEPTS